MSMTIPSSHRQEQRGVERRDRACLLAGGALAVCLLAGVTSALAQPAPTPVAAPVAEPAGVPSTAPVATPSPAPSAAPAAGGDEKNTGSAPPVDEVAKQKASELRKGAKKLFDKGEHSAALAAYQSAFRLFPSWGSLTGAGACLLKLQRFDEALDAFEVTARDYTAVLPKATREEVLRQVDTLRAATGAVVVTGAEVGAMIVIDGRVRGEHPRAAPLPVLPGAHLVRVYKDGFALHEKSLDVGKGQTETLAVKLTPLAQVQTGRLVVSETGGKKMEVVVDGVPVGVSPWEGPVSAGEHTVVLRPLPPADPLPAGEMSCSVPLTKTEQITLAGTEDIVATVPVTVVVQPGESAPLQMKAVPLDATVKILPSPATATLSLDGVSMGRGGFQGRIQPGYHLVEVTAEGYFPEKQKVSVPAGEERAVQITLRKDWSSPVWAEAGRFWVELSGGAALSPSLGGEVAAGCKDTCKQSIGGGGRVALRGGYQLGNGVSIGGTLGYLAMEQTITGRSTQLLPIAIAGIATPDAIAGVANDTLAIQSFLVGPYAALRLGKRFPVSLGLAAGLALSQVSDRRTGLFGPFAVGPVTQSGLFPWIFVEPELRVGVRVTEHLTLGVSVSGLLLFAPAVPRWNEGMAINPHGGQLGLDDKEQNRPGLFPGETITGSTLFAITEGLSVRYEL